MLQREMEDPSDLDSKGVGCAFCCAKTESLTSRIYVIILGRRRRHFQLSDSEKSWPAISR